MLDIKKLFKYNRMKKKLYKLNPEEIPKFDFNGLKKFCRVVKVYDGDTCTVLFIWRKKNIKINCRLYGIDTPEIRTSDEEEKERGIKARDFLREMILEKIITINFLDNDKYGRPLAILYINDMNINELMIEKGYAKKYFGGKK